MIWTPFKKIPKRFLGIDIGTAAIKIVELASFGERIKLENYGGMSVQKFSDKSLRTFDGSTILLSTRDIARAIGDILKEAKIETKDAVFAIPDFSSFFTFLDLPPMTRDEVSSAVQFEARQHIPLPLTEVAFDWSIIEGEVSDRKKEKLKVLLVAVPYETINQYQEVAKLSQIRLLSLEAEVFGLIRSLIKDKKGIIGLVDMGAQSTTMSVAENGVLKITHSFDISGNELTRVLSKSLNIGYNEAEELKQKYGLSASEMEVAKVLRPLIDLMIGETEKIARNFYQIRGKEMEKIIMAGGAIFLPGLLEYFSSHFKKPVELANPFVDILYPPLLAETLKKMGPAYAVAVGTALRGFE